MKTEDLIRAMAADTMAPPPLRLRLLMGLLPALIVAVLAVWLLLGFREDLATALVTPVSGLRILLAGLLGVVAARLVLMFAQPGGAGAVPLWPLSMVAGAALVTLASAFLSTAQESRQMAMMGKTMTTCLTVIPVLSILPVAVLHHVLREGAPTAPRGAGFVAGLAGSGFAAAIYALYCTEDSPLFYITWYGVAILSVALVSALIGPRSLRW